MSNLQTAGEYMEALAGARDLIAAQQVEIEQLRKDAERYRWLREQDDSSEVFCMYGRNSNWGACGHCEIYGELLDETVDAAIIKEKYHG